MPTIHLDGATWRKLLISYTQLASYLTRISLVPTSPAVITSSSAKFKIADCATCTGVGGMEEWGRSWAHTTPTSFGY